MIFSFIIPIYNGALFIEKTIKSLLNQDISHYDYEIVCVDDCSTDNSVKVIGELVNEYDNIKIIRHKKNSRVATACNTGLANASGKYFWIIGQDDWIKENCLKKIVQLLENKKLDVLLFNYLRVDSYGNRLEKNTVFENSQVMKGIDFINYYFKDNFEYYLLGFTWRSIIKTDFIKQYNIKFKEGMTFEDTIFMFKSVILSERVSSITDEIYYYRVNDKSIMYDLEANRKGALIYEFAFMVGDEVGEFADEIKNKFPEIAERLYKMKNWYYNTFWLPIIKTNRKEKQNFYKLIKQNPIDKKGLTFLSKLFIVSNIGYYLSLISKPIYLIKKKITG